MIKIPWLYNLHVRRLERIRVRVTYKEFGNGPVVG